jgi:hypothetical protein
MQLQFCRLLVSNDIQQRLNAFTYLMHLARTVPYVDNDAVDALVTGAIAKGAP